MPQHVPLTWAQRSWMLVQGMSDDDAWRHGVEGVAEVPRRVGADKLADVLGDLVRKHPPLRGRLLRDGGALQQEIVECGSGADLTPTVLLVAGPDREDEAVDEVRRTAIARRVPTIAATLQHGDRGTSRIRFVFAHAFADAWAGHLVSRMVVESLTSSRVHPAQSTLHDLVEFENGPRGRELSQRNLRQLLRVAEAAAELGVLPSGPPGRSAGRVDLLSREQRSTWLRDVVALLGGPSRTVRAAAMLSLVFLAYCASSDERRGAVFQVPVTNRFDAREQDYVGLLMMRTWLLVEWVPDETFGQLVKRVTRKLLLSCTHVRIDPHDMRDGLAALGPIRPPELYFNYSEPGTGGQLRIDGLRRDGVAWDDEVSRWMRAPAGGCDFEYNAYVREGAATVVTKFDGRFVEQFDVGAFDAGLKGAAAIALEEPGLPLAAVRDRIGGTGPAAPAP